MAISRLACSQAGHSTANGYSVAMIDYRQTKFLISESKASAIKFDEGVEVAFIGRSNAGKSSLLNALTEQNKLAKTSKTPGRTRLINFFEVEPNKRIVDLPGFGYAKVSKDMKKEWEQELTSYLETREQLKLLVMVMDVRHPFQPIEEWLLEWAYQCELPVHIVLNKSDKLKKGPAKNTLFTVQNRVRTSYNNVTVQLFSSLKRDGIPELREKLTQIFNQE